jgi:hypothetical protein
MLRANPHLFSARCLSLAVTAAVALAPVAGVAAPSKKKGKKAAAEAPATDGKTVALLNFSGDPKGADLRSDIALALEEQGFSVKKVALDLSAAAKRIKCKDDIEGASCLEALGEWLNANPKTAADFIVYGSIDPAPPKKAHIVAYDIGKKDQVEAFDTVFVEQDLILPIALPRAIGQAVQDRVEPPPPASEEEMATIAALDEPEKTPEMLKAEADRIAKAQAEAEQMQQDAVVDTSNIEVDLKKDFKDFCRDGKRTKRKSKDDPKDLRPSCKRGPFWGYWQPRAWVALGLTVGAGIGTIALYSAALAARGPYSDAVDALDAYNANTGGCDPVRDPNCIVNGDQAYDALATEVSRTGATMRQRAIIGDVLLGTTVLLFGVTAIIVYQDRRDAKEFIRQEKGLRAISDLNVGPILTKDTKGAGVSFKF